MSSLALFLYACGAAFMWSWLDDEGYFEETPRANHWILWLIVALWFLVIPVCLIVEGFDRITGRT